MEPAGCLPRRRSVKSRLAVLATLALLTACGSQETSSPGASDVRSTSAEEVAVLVAPPANSGQDAGVGGRVQVLDGCLAIGDFVALWPDGTDVLSNNDESVVIDVPGLGRVEIGDEVSGAGGFAGPSEYNGTPPLPASCADAGVVTFRPE